MTLESPYYEEPKKSEGLYPFDKAFEAKLAAAFSGKWPEKRTAIDEVHRDAFFQKALALMGSVDTATGESLVDEEVKEQFLEDIKDMKYEDMEALFVTYEKFVPIRHGYNEKRKAEELRKKQEQEGGTMKVVGPDIEEEKKAA